MGDERRAGVEALPRREPAEPAGEDPDANLSDQRREQRDRDDPAHLPHLAEVDGEREGEEEERGEDVAEREEPLLDLLPHPALGEDHAGHQRADRLGQLEPVREGAHPDDEAEHREQEELELEPREESAERRPEPAGDRERRADEDQRLRRHERRRPCPATAGRDEAEDGGDRDVLEEEDRQDEIGLVVGEPPEVGQRLDRDRARRDVDAGRDDERGEADAEGRPTHEQPEARVDEEIRGAAEPDVPATPDEPLDAELEAEEEEEEDQSDLGDELRHLGGLDEADEVRIVRAEDDPREQVGRDRGEPEPARRETEDAEERDRDRELGEGHRRPFLPRGGALPAASHLGTPFLRCFLGDLRR